MSEATDTTTQDAGPAADPLTEAALATIQAALPDAVVASETAGRHPWIQVTADSLRQICRLLRDDEKLAMDCVHLISGVDYPKDNELEVLYHLCSYTVKPSAEYRKPKQNFHAKNDPFVCLKVRVPRDAPQVPTVMDIWIGADWHERETFDLVGIEFTGRTDLQRILLPEDWPGHPLRKDWQYPAEYHGIPIIPPEGL